MAYKHGIYTSEVPTSLTPPVEVDGGLIVAWGTAPIHLAKNPAKTNEPVLCYDYSEAVEHFGYSEDFENYTLSEVMSSQFVLFNVAPIVLINVLDPNKHFEKVENREIEGIISASKIFDEPILLDSFTAKSEKGTEKVELEADEDFEISEGAFCKLKDIESIDGKIELTYTADTDTIVTEINISDLPYTLPGGVDNVTATVQKRTFETLTNDIDYVIEYNSDNQAVLTILDAGKITDDKIFVSYKKIDPSKVTKNDIIGGIDGEGNATGLELIESIFPTFRLVPGTLIAPKFSADSTVAAVMKAKTTNINDVFSAISLCDIDTEKITDYTKVAEEKNKKNLLDTSLIVCYPKISLGGVQYHLSTQLASLMNLTDSKNGDIPYKSPSNERLQCDSAVLSSGIERNFSLPQANYLNGNGVVTALNFANGWVCWGNRSSVYPASTDPKDSFIAIRRMFNWIKNTLILTFFAQVDQPLNKRLLERIQDSANIWLNGLTARGALNGGRIEILSSENTKLDLMDGVIRFHVYITPPSPARQLDFICEYDPNYLSDLLG